MTAFCLALAPPVQAQDSIETKIQNAGERFDAQILLMPESELVEFDKPSDQQPRITLLDQVSLEDKVALKLVFFGMATDENGAVDVTYDLRVTRPDGSRMEDGTHEDLVAYQGPIGNPNNVYNSETTLVLSFDPGDSAGDYDIRMVVRDNISDRDVSLRKSLSLVVE